MPVSRRRNISLWIFRLAAMMLLLLQFIALSSQSNRNIFAKGEEAVFVQTDRDLYVAGETIQFNLVLLCSPSQDESLSRIAYILLRNASGKTITRNAIDLDGQSAAGSIYLPDTLGSGLFQLVAFTNWMRNAGEETFFARPLLVVNRFDKSLKDLPFAPPVPEVSVTDSLSPADSLLALAPSRKEEAREAAGLWVETDRSVYARRAPVILSWKNELRDDSLVSLCLSVVRKPALVDAFHREQQVFTRMGRGQATMAQAYARETMGSVLGGSLVSRTGGTQLSGARVYLTTPDSLPNFQYAVSDSRGNFNFLLNPFYESRTLFLTLDPSSVSGSPILRIDDKFRLDPHWSVPFDGIDRDQREYLLQSQVVVGIQKYYRIPMVGNAEKNISGCAYRPLLYSRVPFSLDPALYYPLDDFQEIARELIPALRIRKADDGYTARLMNEARGTLFENPPFFFLNSVPVFRLDKIIPLGSDQVRRVDVLNLEWAHGELVFEGLVSVYSKDEDFFNYQELGAGTKLEYPAPLAYHPPMLPDHTPGRNPDPHLPDFRQLLYWQPRLQAAGTGAGNWSFFTGDLSGEFEVVLEGVTSRGKIIRRTMSFEVE